MTKKILVIGAFGKVGKEIVKQLMLKGYQVTAAGRHIDEVVAVSTVVLDASNSNDVAKIADNFDAVIASVSGRVSGQQTLPIIAHSILQGLEQSNCKRLLWVGGAGSLLVAPNVEIKDTPNFPAAYKDEADSQSQVLALFKQYTGAVQWTYFSPATMFEPGSNHADYIVKAGDDFFTNKQGESRISYGDFSLALIDEIEQNNFLNTRVAVAYR